MAANPKKNKEDFLKLELILERYQSLFDILDIIFALLRIINPNTQEINDCEKAITLLDTKWRELGISITPKFHILTRHTIEQVRQFGGIADLVEDFIEKSHQVGKKLDHYVDTMSNKGYEQQELAKIRSQWLSNDPRVLERLSTVKEDRKQKKSTEKCIDKNTISKENKKIKREKNLCEMLSIPYSNKKSI